MSDADDGCLLEVHQRARWPILLAVVAVLAIHVVGRVGAYCSPIHADSYVYATVGYRISQGEVFYRDVSDVKPPASYLLYALAYKFLPPGRATMIPVETLFSLLGYCAIYLLARELYGRRVGLVVLVTAALAMNFFMEMDFATDGYGLAEGFMILPAAAAVRHYRRGRNGDSLWRFFGCGIWIGLGFAVKQTMLPLAVAIAAHWILQSVLGRKITLRSLVSAGTMIAGALAALSPFVMLVIVQGTWRRALEVLGPDAARMLTLETAFPSQWSNVLPLWVPMVLCIMAIAWWTEDRRRNRMSGAAGGVGSSLSASDLQLLLLWFGAECVMLVFLPLRAYHYYVLSCLPVVILSGAFWAGLEAQGESMSRRGRFASVAVAAVLSMAFVRTAVDTMVPAMIGKYRSYDSAADRAYFDGLLARGITDFGAPPASPTD